jgi:hypothetical protein
MIMHSASRARRLTWLRKMEILIMVVQSHTVCDGSQNTGNAK